MKEQKPEIRAKNFQEVSLGYTPEQAMQEAKRCLQCKNAPCKKGCPAHVLIPEFIKLITEEKLADAAMKIKETHAYPSVCGRVCPQEHQCEGSCVFFKRGDPIAIGNLERYVGDWERENLKEYLPTVKMQKNKKVAIIGSGPAGITAARELAREGFDVSIFEALHETGGVLTYGIPEFRLPKDIVQTEINRLLKKGVKIIKNTVINKSLTIDDLLQHEGFAAVFIGAGAGLPAFMNIPGENSVGVYSANEYLTRVNLMRAYSENTKTPIIRGKTVVTVGGGNVAMDAARTALRLGAERSLIIYRRTEAEMPARLPEVHHAKEEGIEFHMLCNPTEIIANEQKRVTAIKCVRMELGEADASGRRSPKVIPGSDFEIPCEAVIIAIGNKPNPLMRQSADIKMSAHGTIEVDSHGRTSKKFVYAAGDIVTGAATVIEAMGAAKIAAKAMMEDLG